MTSKPIPKPLCSTCSYHETQSTRINIMWGAGWVWSLVIAPVIIGGVVFMIMANDKHIDANAASIEKCNMVTAANIKMLDDKLILKTDHLEAVDRKRDITLNTLTINLRRLMQAQGVTFITSSTDNLNAN